MKTKNIINTLKLCDDALDRKVRIQGTKFDRKYKYDDSDFKKAKKMLKRGMNFSEIAKATGLNYTTLRYRLDEEFKQKYNCTRKGLHTGVDKVSKVNRVSYKRNLIASGALAV